MKLNPKRAPLYGECVLTVQLSEEECVEDEEDVEFYLLFSGSTQRHLTTTLRLGHVTLQAVCPAHDCDETVRVTLCQARPGGSVDPVAEDRFQFVQDLALDMARFLISTTAHRDGEGALLLTHTDMQHQERETLDEMLSLALKHLPLPPGWSVLGPDINAHTPTDFCPHETLLHFAARGGLRRVTLFLIQQPGGRDALHLTNRHGHTPAQVAQSKGHTQLHHLLSELENSPHLETKAPRRCHPAGRVFLHHPRLNTFTLTVQQESDGEPPDLRRDVEELRRYAGSRCNNTVSQKQLRSFPLILSREFVDVVTPSEDPSHHKPPAYDKQEVQPENREEPKHLNGSIQSQLGEVLEFCSGHSDPGLDAEGVCTVRPGDVSCGEQQQQQEEVDSELRLIREASGTQNKIQSGNTEEGRMGQTQGLLPEKQEENKARGDLPEEREGECNAGQEALLLSGSTQPLDGETTREKRSCSHLNLDITVDSEKAAEFKETGHGNEQICDFTVCTKQDQDFSEGLDSLSFKPNMTPRPVHSVHLEQPPVSKQSLDQSDALPETASVSSSEQVSSESSYEPAPCDVTDPLENQKPDRLVHNGSLTTEEVQIDQTLVPDTEEGSSAVSKRDFQPIISTEVSEENSQLGTVSCYRGEEPSEKHADPQSDTKDTLIIDTEDKNPDLLRSLSSSLVLDQISACSPRLTVYDSNPEETSSGPKSKLENEPLAFQTPPESPCEFFSVDGFNRTGESIDVTSSALLAHVHVGSGETKESEKMETELQEMCESIKKSPVTILCGSFSKLTIRGSSLDPQLDSTTSKTIEITAPDALCGDLETNMHLSEMAETKEKNMKMGPKLVEKSETPGTSQGVRIMPEAPPCDCVAKENLRGKTVPKHVVGSDQTPEVTDAQEQQLVENPKVSSPPCQISSPSFFVSQNITHDQHSDINFEENIKTSEDSKPEILIIETPLCPVLEVSTVEGQTEVMSIEENIRGTSLDLHPDPLTSSEETIIEMSHDPLPEVTPSKESVEDQQTKVINTEDSFRGTSLDLHPDLKISSQEKSVEISLTPLLEVTPSKESVEDQQSKVINSEDSIRGTSLEHHHDLMISPQEKTVEISLPPFPEVTASEERFEDHHNITGTSPDPNHKFTSIVEIIGEASCGSLLDNLEENVQVQELEKSKNYLHDHQHEQSTIKESIEELLDFHHDLIPSEEPFREISVVPDPEGNTSDLIQQELTESSRGTSLYPSHHYSTSFKEEIRTVSLRPSPEVTSSEENVLDQPPEAMTSEKSKNATSHNLTLKERISEKSTEDPHHLEVIEETALEHQPEITAFEERVRETSHHSQHEETTCEADIGTSHKVLPEVMSSKIETHFSEAPISDSLPLETGISNQPLEMSSVMDLADAHGLDVDPSSSVKVQSGLMPPLDNVDLHKSGILNDQKSHTEEERGEEPTEERVVGDSDGAEAVKTQTDQCSEIHKEEEEVFNSLDSLKQKENTETDVVGVSVCRSVSATALPESISDGDSLLSPDSTDGMIFNQSEDTLTLTSGISMTGSVSPDDSSITHTAGEPEEEEKKDRLMEVLERSDVLRSTARSVSPSRRHSWGPSKDHTGETDMGQRSVVVGEVGERTVGHRRSMSWCPSHVPHPEMQEMNSRSYSLDGLDDEDEVKMVSVRHSTHSSVTEREERGSLTSLNEEENKSNTGDNSSLDSQRSVQDVGCGFVPPQTLIKSISMSAISSRDLDELTETGGLVEYSISEEDPAPLRNDFEVKGTKVSRTFSYLKNKMSKKSKEKDRDKNKDGKEKEKKTSNGHLFSPVLTPPPSPCLQCNRPISTKEALTCINCNVHVHKGCRDTIPACPKVKMKSQTVTDSVPPGVSSRGKSASARERPWSTFLLPEDQMPPPRKNPSIMTVNSGSLSKSISISNIAGQSDEAPLKVLKVLSQSTDSLNKMGKVNESTESLTDEGTELMDTPLMVEFEVEVKELEADSWSFTVDKKYLKHLKKDVMKRQDVIYELIQTEMHHVRTLRIMSEVYSKGLQKEVQVEPQTLEKMFPVLEELLELHTHFLTHLLERRREAREEERGEGGFVICRIGDVLLAQVTGSNAEKMKRVYGKFCSRHNEAVNVYKELHTRDKRFQAFIKKKMSSAVVRRLSIPECILLVTQRITKYPVLLQRLLQHTRDPEEEQADVSEALRQVKEVITGVDCKVNYYEKRRRLKEVYTRTDSKSIMRMKSGQMFAREDLIRGRKLLHDGPLQVKNAAGRLKDVHALLLSDVFVFLQEKDQKYVFASLDQRSTVISLQKLIVREVANEERGLFFITAGIEKPEMVEVHASSKDERNTWMQLILNATTSIDKDDDEGIPSENEEDKRIQESKAKEMRDQLQKKDDQIVTLLEEKVRLFHELCDCTSPDDASLHDRMLFRATSDDVTKGEPIVRNALKEVETLQELVNSSVIGQQVCVGQEDSSVCAGSVSLPRRAETFGGFDCHQMNISKNGDREEADDLRRTESDSVLKKGGTANLLLLHKRNSEQVLQSVTRLHDLLNTLQAVVVQQDTFIEEQRQAMSAPSLRHPSISSLSSVSSLSSSCSSRPSSLMEQEKQRQEEKIREEERRRREEDEKKRREEEEESRRREEELAQREEKLLTMETETRKRWEKLQQEQQELNVKKEEYQRELLRLREDQRRLEREREQLHTHTEALVEQRLRTSSTASEDSLKLLSSPEPAEGMEVFSRSDSKRIAKNLNPFSTGTGPKGGTGESHGQIPTRLLQLTKAKDKKEKKKKKGKGGTKQTEALGAAPPETSAEKDVFFC